MLYPYTALDPRTLARWWALFVVAVVVALAAAARGQVTIRVDDGRVTVQAPRESVTMMDAEERRAEAAGESASRAAPGFTPRPEPGPDTRVIYVSQSGDDRNAGTSPDAPLKTLEAAQKAMRPLGSDQMLLKAGDTFDKGFGNWTRSGRSAERPVFVGVYGEGPRPMIRTFGDGLLYIHHSATVQHVIFQGFAADAARRNPASPEFDADDVPYREGGVTAYGRVEDVLFEDLRLSHYGFNFVLQASELGRIRDVTIRRCIVLDAWNHWDAKVGGGHSSGLFAKCVAGLTVEQSLFDHNGWAPAEADVEGAGRTLFNHNLYVQMDCSKVDVRDNIVSRGASHGLQLRCGGDVTNNLFYRNSSAFFVAREDSHVARNVVLQSDDISKENPRGFGIDVLPVRTALVEGNIISQKRGSLPVATAIKVSWDKGSFEFTRGQFDVTLRDNLIHDWPQQNNRTIEVDTDSAKVTQTNNVIDAPGWPDPDRDLARYAATVGVDGDGEAVLDALRNRPRNTWPDGLTATAINAYIRAGFGID